MFTIKAALLFLRSPLARYIGIALAVAGLCWWGYMAIGNRFTAACERKHQLALAESIERATTQAHQLALQDAEVSEYYEKWRTQVIVRNVVEEVTHEIPADCMRCGIGPDGLRKLNEIRSGSIPTDAAKPDVGVPAPASPYDGITPGTRWLLGPGQPSLQRLRHEAQAVGGASQGEGI